MSRKLGRIRPAESSVLTPIELTRVPQAIASENIDIGYTESVQDIQIPRASNLLDCCIRAHVIATKFNVEGKQRLTAGERLTFAIGDLVHSWVQNTSDVLGDNRYGWWKCEACGARSGFGGPRRRKCKNCGAKSETVKYEEVHIKTGPPFPCSGHPDMFIMKQGRLRLLEIKTMNGEDFKKLLMPLATHQWQIQFYMMACKQDPQIGKFIDPTVGYVLYIPKAHIRDSPYKMFVVERDKAILDAIKLKLSVYNDCVNDGFLPPLMADCERSEFTSWTARGCACMEICKQEAQK